MSTIQGNAIEGSLFTIAIKLNSNIVRSTDCYIITASNGTYEIMLNGSISLPAMSKRADSALFSLIVIPIAIVSVIIGVIVIGVIFWRRKNQYNGNQLSFSRECYFSIFLGRFIPIAIIMITFYLAATKCTVFKFQVLMEVMKYRYQDHNI